MRRCMPVDRVVVMRPVAPGAQSNVLVYNQRMSHVSPLCQAYDPVVQAMANGKDSGTTSQRTDGCWFGVKRMLARTRRDEEHHFGRRTGNVPYQVVEWKNGGSNFEPRGCLRDATPYRQSETKPRDERCDRYHTMSTMAHAHQALPILCVLTSVSSPAATLPRGEASGAAWYWKG